MAVSRKASAFIAATFSIVLSSAAWGQASPSDFTTGYRYDIEHHLTGTIAPDPDGAGPLHYGAVRNTYDPAGRLVKVEKGELASWQSESVAPASWPGFTILQTVETDYDALDRKIKETQRGGDLTAIAVTQYSYDPDGRLDCTTVRMNAATFGSLPASACTQRPDDGGERDRITRNFYDAAGELIQVRKAVLTDKEAAEATYSYTPNGNKEYVIDGEGNRARFVYDGHDRLYQWQFPSTTRPGAYNDSTQTNAIASSGSENTNDFEQYTYDNASNRTLLRKRDGVSIGYSYDALSRMTHKGGSTIADVDYSYDLQGHQLTATYSTGGAGITNSYTGFGELKTSTANDQGPSLTLSYAYDANGNRYQLTFPDGQLFTYYFDGLDRQNSLFEGPSTTQLLSIGYDALGRRAWIGRNGAGATYYAYDNASRLQGMTNDLNGTANDHNLQFGYNLASQIISKTASNDAYVWTSAFNVNRSYATNGLNQYTAAGSATFGYDLNGNLTRSDSTYYCYDAENHLTGSGAGAGDCSSKATLNYDPMGRLTKTVGSGSTTRLLYDGDDLVGVYDGNGNLTRRYVHGPGEDEPLVQYEGANLLTRRLLYADQQGSVVATSDAGGNLIGSPNRYDEYGVPQTDSSGQNVNSGRFQYTGQQWIPELGMYYYKARFYSPTLGRFMQTDPIGYDDQINLYAYVGDDPANATDPDGQELVAGVVGAGIGTLVDLGLQVAQDVSSRHFSGADSYAAAAVGGAAGGFTTGMTGSITAGAAVDGGVQEGMKSLVRGEGLQMASRKALVGAGVGAVAGRIGGRLAANARGAVGQAIRSTKIGRVAARNEQAANMIGGRMRSGQISNLNPKTLARIGVAAVTGSAPANAAASQIANRANQMQGKSCGVGESCN